MPKKMQRITPKKKRAKNRIGIVNLFVLLFLLIATAFTIIQTQQKQTLQEHAASTDCGVPGDKGNEMGVGKYCTQGGGQCLGTGSPICSADIELSGHGICSKACNTDADCGTGATCYQDTLGKGCKPDVCSSNPPTATLQPTAHPTLKPIPTAIPTVKPTPTPTRSLVATAVPTKAIPTAIPQSTNLQFTVFLHGIGNSGDTRNQISTLSNKTPIHTQRTFTITLLTPQNQPITTQQNVFSYNASLGAFTGTADMGTIITTGGYTISIKTASFVKKTIQGVPITKGQLAKIASVSLVAGDVNNDNSLDTLDYNAIISCISILSQPKSCTAAQKQAADLNDDGSVNQTDYNLFLREVNAGK